MMVAQSLVLIVDDDPDFIRIAEFLLDQHGYRAASAGTAAAATAETAKMEPDIILLDQRLGDEEGTSLIGPLKECARDAPIILVTAHNTVQTAVKAIKAGAFDFLPKPLEEARLVPILAKAAEHGRLARHVRALEHDKEGHARFEELVGQSPQMQTVYRIIDNVAPTTATVMITGESGTGKELVARAIHRRSRRSGRAFVPLNMGALPRELVEATLFGHERGAFTGAERSRVGSCQEADGGTLFLDEVREMPIDLQPKLLRFLQERVLRRVGGSTDMQVDVRLISATNVDPLADVRDKRLREDLYYRLNVVPVELPPLRERLGDVPLLATYALRDAARRHEKAFESLDDEALSILTGAPWPGNVRQLFHMLERVVILNEGQVVTASMLPPDLAKATIPSVAPSPVSEPSEARPLVPAFPPSSGNGAEIIPLEVLERQAIIAAIEICGSAAQAARRLRISEATIYRRIR